MDIQTWLSQLTPKYLLGYGVRHNICTFEEYDEIMEALDNGWSLMGNALSQLICFALYDGILPNLKDFDLSLYTQNRRTYEYDPYQSGLREKPRFYRTNSDQNPRISYGRFFHPKKMRLLTEDNPFNWAAAYLTANGIVYARKFREFLESKRLDLELGNVVGGIPIQNYGMEKLLRKGKEGYILHYVVESYETILCPNVEIEQCSLIFEGKRFYFQDLGASRALISNIYYPV